MSGSPFKEFQKENREEWEENDPRNETVYLRIEGHKLPSSKGTVSGTVNKRWLTRRLCLLMKSEHEGKGKVLQVVRSRKTQKLHYHWASQQC